MASDGCQPVDWQERGAAFPYLMHHPGFVQTETYGSKREGTTNAAPAEPSQRRDRTGTWNGPAPRGYADAAGADTQPARAAPCNDPPYALLPGGARMPLLCLGTYKITDPASIRAALASGYRHFDCASFYGNQAAVGEGLIEFTAGGRRPELFIVSKLWNDEHHPEDVRRSAEKSISDLGCGYLDLLLMHWPHAWVKGTKEEDPSISLLDTWRAMESLVDAGLVRHIGVSNFGLRLLEELLAEARIKPVLNQVELHPLLAQRKLVGVCLRKGVLCSAHSCLGHSKRDVLDHPTVQRVAQETGKTPAQVVLKWNVQRGVAVIPKASSPNHIAENAEGLFSWRLSPAHKCALDALDCGKRFVNESWHTWEDPEEGGATKPSTVL